MNIHGVTGLVSVAALAIGFLNAHVFFPSAQLEALQVSCEARKAQLVLFNAGNRGAIVASVLVSRTLDGKPDPLTVEFFADSTGSDPLIQPSQSRSLVLGGSPNGSKNRVTAFKFALRK